MGPMDSVVGVAFWTFVAIAAIGSFWREFAIRREREKTVRAMLEQERQIDPTIIRAMLRHQSRISPEGLLIGGAVTLAGGAGLPLMGYFIGLADLPGDLPSPFYPLLGVGSLAASIGVALLLVGQIMRKRAAAAEAEHGPAERP